MVQSGQSYELFCPYARAYETVIPMVTNTKKRSSMTGKAP